MKYLFQIFFLLYLILFVGCQTNTTPYEIPIIIDDQEFNLLEESPAGTVIGHIKVKNEVVDSLNFYLVSGEHSNAFEMEVFTGRLILKDSSLINYQLYKQFSLEVMVKYENSNKSYGIFAKILIRVEKRFEPFTWIVDNTTGKNQNAVVNSSQPDSNQENSNFFIASAWTSNLQSYVVRSFFQFDLSAFPRDAVFTRATLSLYNPNDKDVYHEQSCFSGPNTSYIRRVTSTWNSQTITWNNQPLFSQEAQIELPASNSVIQNYENIDVSELVQYMIQNPDENYGFILILDNENYYRRLCFASLKYPVEIKRPKLEINYLD